jgi:tRNA(Ile)-lysidine synthase
MARIEQLEGAAVFASWQSQLDSAPQILVGFSGGLDSTVLLTLLSDLVPAQRLCAVHINHGLSVNAGQWQSHVDSFCQSLGVQLHCETVSVKAAGEGLEAAAREARYRVFSRLIQPHGLLVLGHHADDQVETVLYRLLRGSGNRGLSGIPVSRSLAGGRVIRPLLQWQKAQIQDFAERRHLVWVEDETNLQSTFDRNYLRNQVIPAIANRWPDYTRRISHSAQLSKDNGDLAETVAADDLQTLKVKVERGGWSLCLDTFTALSALRQRNVLRHWPGVYQLPLPGHKIINEVIDSIVKARDDATQKVLSQCLQWVRFRNRLYLLSAMPDCGEVYEDLHWHTELPLSLPDGSCLRGEKHLGQGLLIPSGQPLTVRMRSGGERCQPAERRHSTSLKKLLQEYNLEPWWRDRIPLLYAGQQLVAVGDLWVCAGYQASSDQQGILIYWHLSPQVDY